MTTSTEERYVVTRTIAATPGAIFAVLADPTRHKDTEPGDWVRDAIDIDRITGTGQMFAMNMFLEQAGGHYVMHNLVTEFDENRTIAWVPGQLDEAGNHGPGGWWWRYDLKPNGAGTDVTRHLRLERNVAGVPRHRRGTRVRRGLHRGVVGDA